MSFKPLETTEFGLRCDRTHEYVAVDCVELNIDLAAFVRHDGSGWDLVMVLSGIALGYSAPDLATCERAVRRLEGEQLFLGDPDLSVLFERAGGRPEFMRTIENIKAELKL